MKAISTKYIGPSNTRGSRISADDGDGNKITVGYRSELNSDANHAAAAVALAKKMGWTGQLVGGSTKSGYVYVWLDDRAIVTVDKTASGMSAAHPLKEIEGLTGEAWAKKVIEIINKTKGLRRIGGFQTAIDRDPTYGTRVAIRYKDGGTSFLQSMDDVEFFIRHRRNDVGSGVKGMGSVGYAPIDTLPADMQQAVPELVTGTLL